MAGVKGFHDLRCWQTSRQLARRIFEYTQRDAFRRDRRLVEQVNDSANSVMANIAEGFGRGTQAEFITFLGYSLGSLDETRSHLCSAYDRKYIEKGEFATLWEDAISIRKMTGGLICSMVMHGSGVKHQKRPCPSWSEQVWEVYERTTGRKRPPMFENTRSSHVPTTHNDEPQI